MSCLASKRVWSISAVSANPPVIAANVVCRCSLNVALTWDGPVVSTALTAGSVAMRVACAHAVGAVVNAMTASSAPSSAAAVLMTVVGPDGNLWSTGQPRVQGAVISIDVMPLGPTGTYTVNYRVTSADGHVVSGSWPFQLATAGTGRPGPPAATPAASGGILIWPFLAIGAVLVAGSAWWALRRRPLRSG